MTGRGLRRSTLRQRPALPGALGRRLLEQLRYRWPSLRGGLSLTACGFAFWATTSAASRGKPPAPQALDPVRPHVFALAACMAQQLPGAMARGRRLRRAARLHPAQTPPHALSIRSRMRPRRRSVPVMPVAMVIEHPWDPACVTLDRQYHLGSQLLVAPDLHRAAVDFLPARSRPGPGRLLIPGAKRASGDRWHRETHDFPSCRSTSPRQRHPLGVIPVHKTATSPTA